MLGFLPVPYPDELLFSVLSRYHLRAGNSTVAATLRELFGSHRVNCSVDIPNNLNTLISRFPRNHGFTTDELIDNHTLLPFYAPFGNRMVVRDAMGAKGSLHMNAGLLNRKANLDFFRYCPRCVKDDIASFGETYWHRAHQLPGILVCSNHQVFLEDSKTSVRWGIRGQHDGFVAARQCVNNTAQRDLDSNNRDHQVLLRLAVEATWLLKQREFGFYQTFDPRWCERYLVQLFGKSLATFNGVVHFQDLFDQFISYYSPTVLSALHANLHAKINWLQRITQRRSGGCPPIQHLLLIQFLGLSVVEILRCPAEIYPYGKPPFPCLNSTADHYKEKIINSVEIIYQQKTNRKIQGTFRCDCGFAYRRYGRDCEPQEQFLFHRVIAFGEVWHSRLRNLWELGYSIIQMCRELNVGKSAIRKESTYLGLIRCSTSKSIRARGQNGNKIDGERLKRLRKPRRTRWLKFRKEYPSWTRVQIKNKIRRTYVWLYLHDRAWQLNNSPKIEPGGFKGACVDWKARDNESSEQAKEVAASLYAATGKPVRVSYRAIARRLTEGSSAMTRPKKVPLTAATIESLSETAEEFAVRRIRWAAEILTEHGQRLKPQSIRLVSSIGTEMLKRPSVKHVFESVLESAEEKDSMKTTDWKSERDYARHIFKAAL